VYRAESKFDTALKYYKKAIKIAEQLDDLSNIATYLNNMGIIYYTRGDYSEAMSRFRRAQKINEKKRDILGIAHSLNSIGGVYFKLGKYPEALKCLKKVVKIFNKLKLGDSPKLKALKQNIEDLKRRIPKGK
jgi:tetratricopeptide (TPR) repeat protein